MSESKQVIEVCARYASLISRLSEERHHLDGATKELIDTQLKGVEAIASLVEHDFMDEAHFVDHLESACDAITQWMRPAHRGRPAMVSG